MKYVAKALLLAISMFVFLAGNAQDIADATVQGRMVVVSSSNNSLVVKLQVKAIHDTNPAQTLMLTSASFWFRYNDSLVSLAEQPVAASSAALLNGDYFYPSLSNPYYSEKVVTRQTMLDNIKPDSKYCISHIVWEGWDDDGSGTMTPHSINTWTDISVVKLKVLKTGTLKLKWDLVMLEEEILDEVAFSYKIGQFDDLVTTVTYQPEALNLAAAGDGTVADPYKVTVRSSNSAEPAAGTTGFYVYYRSADARAAIGTDKLNSTPFFWGNATIVDEPIANVSKDTVIYNRRLSYTSTDGTQSNDSWPALAAAAREALYVVFTPTTYGAANGIKTYLETINSASFKTWDESEVHTVAVNNAYKLLGSGSGGGSAPLPVSLVDFSATLQNRNTVLLNWATASEQNNAVFEVERSANGREFTRIASVKGNGTTATFHTYSATDPDPLTGISYYRLKQVDFDKKAGYSKVVLINNAGRAESLNISMVYPNPAKDQARLVFSLDREETLSLKFTDLLGRVVSTESLKAVAGVNTHSLGNLAALPAGVYILNLSGKGKHAAIKVVKE